MAQITPRAGKTYGVTWTPDGGSTATLNVTDHSWSEMVDAIDVTTTGAAGVQSLLAGILRGEGTVKAFLDISADSTTFLGSTQAIVAGQNGSMVHLLGTNTNNISYTVPCMITRVNSAVPVNGAVNYEFTVQLNDLAVRGSTTATTAYVRDGAISS